MKSKMSQKTSSGLLRNCQLYYNPVHISEEIWSNLGNKTLCINQSWPLEDIKKKTKLKIAIQINGKTKEIIEIEDKITKEMVLEIVKNNEKSKRT